MSVPGDTQGREDGSSEAPLYLLFALTGVGTALLGATLPVFLPRWQLTDTSAGMLFLLLFVASSSGSLVPRPYTAQVVASASGLLALAAVALAVTHGRGVFPVTAAFGFGLGLAISTVTRVCLRCPEPQRVTRVNRLNFVWGLGAFLSPTVGNGIIRHAGVPVLFLSLAGAFAAVGLWTALDAGRGRGRDSGDAGVQKDLTGPARLPWEAATGAFLAVGIESALGAWLATYAHRFEGGMVAPVEATTLFWLGLLASRALCSTRWTQGVSSRRLLLPFVLLTAAGCGFLVASRWHGAVLVAAGLAGTGVGPVFPLLQASVLPRVRGNLLFVIAGLGSSLLPLFTGIVSTHFGSLRIGLMTPALAAAALLGIAPRLAGTLERLGRPLNLPEAPEAGRQVIKPLRRSEG